MSYAESEDRKLMLREVKALESIAKSLDRLVKKYENPNLPARDINKMLKDEEKHEYYIDPEKEGLVFFKTLSDRFAVPIFTKKTDDYSLTTNSAIEAITKELMETFKSLPSNILFDYIVLSIRKEFGYTGDCNIYVDIDFYVTDKEVYLFKSTRSLYDYLMED